jgi:hypothetical protein
MPGVKSEAALDAAQRLQFDDHVGSISWSADGTSLAAACMDGTVGVVADGRRVQGPPGHELGASVVAWSPAAPLLASGGLDGTARIWDVAGEAVLGSVSARGWCGALAWRPDGADLAVAIGRSVVRIEPDGREHLRHDDHPSTVGCLAWTPDGRHLGVGAYGGLWWYQGAVRATKRFPWTGALLTLAISPDGRWAASGNQDASVHCWKLWSADELSMSGYQLKVEAVAWSPDSALLAVANAGEATLWDFRGKGPRGQKPTELNGHARRVVGLGFGLGGSVLATAGAEGRLCVWDLSRSSKRLIASRQFDDELSCLAWAPDGCRLAVATGAGAVWEVDVAGSVAP